MIILWRKSFSRGLSLIEVSIFSIILSLATIYGMLAYKDYSNKKNISMVSFELSALSDALEKYIQISKSKLVKEELSVPKEVNVNVLYDAELLPRRSNEHIIFGQKIKLYIKKEKVSGKDRIVGLLLTVGGKPMNGELVKLITLYQGGRGGETRDGNLFNGVFGGWALNLRQDWIGVSYSSGHLLSLIEPNIANFSSVSDIYNENKDFSSSINIEAVASCINYKCENNANRYLPKWYPVFVSDALRIDVDSKGKDRYVLEVVSSKTNELLHRSFRKGGRIFLLPDERFLNKDLDITISRVDKNGRKLTSKNIKVSALESKNNARKTLSIDKLWGTKNNIVMSLWHNGKTIHLDEVKVSDGKCNNSLIRDVTLNLKQEGVFYTLKKGGAICANSFVTNSILFSDNTINNGLIAVDRPSDNYSSFMEVEIDDITLNQRVSMKIKYIPDNEDQDEKE